MSTETTRCWEIRWGSDEEEAIHFPTREKAEENRSSHPTGTISQLDRDCHVIVCATEGCGHRFDEGDEGGPSHFPSREEAIRWALMCDWTNGKNGPVCHVCVEYGHYEP